MFGYFYNSKIRKVVAMFGAIFDEMYIVKKTSSGSFQQTRVPFSYGPKNKFLERIQQMDRGEENEYQVALNLPRMSFEMTSISYDATRQLPKMNNRKFVTNGSYSKAFVGVPYIISMSLSIYAKTYDEAHQIVEQIIPYFGPQYTISIKAYENIDDLIDDVPINLASVSFADDYENDVGARRTIIWDLEFELKVNFYGPEPSAEDNEKVIRRVIGNMHNMHDSDSLYSSVRIELDPFMTSEDSDYSIITTIQDSDG